MVDNIPAPESKSDRVLRVGTRGSALALTQTGHVMEAIEALHSGVRCVRVVIKTSGDVRQNVPFATVGVKGMFVKEIEEALIASEIDFAVHSMKDMPGELPSGLALGAVPRRQDPRDALLSNGRALAELPTGARVGTSSLRRAMQTLRVRPDLKTEELRGNLDTRVRKLKSGEYDAIILAAAGLERMGWAHHIVERLPVETHVPAPGQGALALEVREDDDSTIALLAALNHPETADAVAAERAFQAELGLGCGVPVGGHAWAESGEVKMVGMMAEADGSRYRQLVLSGDRRDAAAIGRRMAHALLHDSGN